MKADELEWVRKQLAKLLGIKRYPDEPWGTLLTNCGDLINTADTPQMLLEEIETSARLAHENHELGLRKGLARRQGLPRERSGGGRKPLRNSGSMRWSARGSSRSAWPGRRQPSLGSKI